MAIAFTEIAFTPAVKAAQSRYGSRETYARLEHATERHSVLTAREIELIAARDSFYQATVGETGWPYVQHRGGPPGFLKVLDPQTIGYADFGGNRQYVSVGNLSVDDRVVLILMDYARRKRLKIWGHARAVHEDEDSALLARLEMPDYRARIERGIIIRIEAWDWNCPQHITRRFTEAELSAVITPLQERIVALESENAALRTQANDHAP